MHSESGETPRDRYLAGSRFTRSVQLNSVLTFFHRRERRTVNKDFSDVRVGKAYYAVDPKFRQDRLIVEYDPFGYRTNLPKAACTALSPNV